MKNYDLKVLRSCCIRMLVVISILLSGNTIHAAYIVHSVTGDVKLETKGKSVPLKTGMTVNPSDMIDIPANGSVDIYNELDSKIYTSVKPGKLSVIRLMLDAKQKASDNSSNVKDHLAVKDKNQTEGRIYMEKGMVKRSQSVFGVDSENVDVDPRTLARYVASVVYSGNLESPLAPPVKIEHKSDEADGIKFRVENTVDFPVYFNVLKITGTQAPVLEVSELGQPTGSYVVLPGQALSREQKVAPPADTHHVLILSHCRYDIGEVIDIIGDLLSTEGVGTLPEKDAPVSMILL